MASIEGELVALLAADSTLSALVGAGTLARIYPQDRPLDTARPYVLYAKAAGYRDCTLTGATNFRQAVFTWDCYGTDEPRGLGVDWFDNPAR